MFEKAVKSRGIKIVLEVIVLVIIYVIAKSYVQRDLVSGTAPDISANLIDGSPVQLAQYQGKPVLLHFWATWCSICKLEQKSIQSLSQSYQVITIAMQSGDRQTVQTFMQQQTLSFPAIADSTGEISQNYGVNAVPSSFILDSKGKIVFTETGYSSEWGLRLRLWMADLRTNE